MVRIKLLIFIAFILIAACEEKNTTNTTDAIVGKDGREVHVFDPQGSAMNEAMEKGKLTLDNFTEAFNNQNQHQSRFSVKVKFGNETNVEYLWLTDLTFEEGKKLQGILLNKPYYSNENIGDTISCGWNEIVDWSYVENGYLMGGYTLRVMFESYTQEQRAKILEQLEYQIDPEIGI